MIYSHTNDFTLFTFNIYLINRYQPYPFLFSFDRPLLSPFAILMRVSKNFLAPSDFFQTLRNSLVVICDSCDNKEKFRFRLFQKWYKSTNNLSIEKIDISIDLKEYSIRSFLLLHQNHPQAQEIKKLFDEWAKMSI